jgi:hypothetical protein
MKKTINRYPWLVVHDPERMYSGPFHSLDLRLTAQAGYWPEGIIFQHQRTRKRLIVQQGRLTPFAVEEVAQHDTQH